MNSGLLARSLSYHLAHASGEMVCN